MAEQSVGSIKASDITGPPLLAKQAPAPLSVRIQPTMHSLFEDSKVIAENELRRLVDISSERSLTDKEIRRYRDLVESVCKQSREQRALDAQMRMDTLTDEELAKQLMEIAKEAGIE